MIIKELKRELKLPKLEFCIPINLEKNMRDGWKQGLKNKITRVRMFDIPSEPGVYIFFNDLMEVMYVGKSINLRNRFNQHMSLTGGSKVYKAMSKSKNNIMYYSYAVCKDDYEARLYEMLYTYLYRPKLSDIIEGENIVGEFVV